MPKIDSTASVSFVCSEKLQIAGRASVVESHLSKVRETSTFCKSVERKLRRSWYVPKSGFLEILRSPLLTGVAGLQYLVCNAT